MNKQYYEGCKCADCDLKFKCGTQERYFTDIQMQGLYEAMIASGKTSEQALVDMVNYLKSQISLSSLGHTITTQGQRNVGMSGNRYVVGDKWYEINTTDNTVNGYTWGIATPHNSGTYSINEKVN